MAGVSGRCGSARPEAAHSRLSPLRARKAAGRIAGLRWIPQVWSLRLRADINELRHVERKGLVEHRTEAANCRAVEPSTFVSTLLCQVQLKAATV
eukprot:1637956-Prymnesium_polylepis.2